MNKRLIAIASVFLMTMLAYAKETVGATALVSGIDTQYIDDAVRAQDDFYRHVNGKWLATVEIPADRGRYDVMARVTNSVQTQLQEIVGELGKEAEAGNPEEKKIADLYASFMDEAALDRLGLKPLDAEFARIDALKDKGQISSLIAHFNRIGVAAPFSPQVHQDAKDATRYVFDLEQGGLGLPNRDYYLAQDAKLIQIRALYGQHVQKMLMIAGDQRAARDAKNIVALESALAEAQWSEVENRNAAKTYNKVALGKLSVLAPGYDWMAYLSESRVAGKSDYVIISQPSYITNFSQVLKRAPLPVWRAYLRWHLLNDFAPYLGKPIAEEHFAFYGAVLQGLGRDKPRWQLGVELLNSSIGEGLGKIYVARYFPPESKARMQRLVNNLLGAYRAEIDMLDWMSPQTRVRAKDKLARITTKIGFPARWRDYGALEFVRDDLVGNVIRAHEFEYDRNINKLGQPVDRAEWDMLPQTVNAHYDAERNEIVFPAAVLQPPFFNAMADDAANYGAAGTAIAHEISHGFDDQGSQYDGNGTLLDAPGWFTAADLDKFRAKTRALVTQYSAYEPVPGYPVNGELTLGENIADNAGLAVAYKAYKLSLGAKEAAVIDRLTGDQRFFMSFAQIFRGKTRESEAIMRIKLDPHAPEEVRGTVPERNLAPFYEAFGVKTGDKMYLPAERRVTIW
ncbi:MAG TPA: M13-type metalloendopeptidase [Steroidobacteraceae bacterium]